MNLIEHPISLDITYFFPLVLYVEPIVVGAQRYCSFSLINIRAEGKVFHLRNQNARKTALLTPAAIMNIVGHQ